MAAGVALITVFGMGSSHGGSVLSENVFGGVGLIAPEDAFFNTRTGGTKNERFGTR